MYSRSTGPKAAPPVAAPGKRRRPRALQLDVAALARSNIDDFSQKDRPSVAELRHKMSKLMPGIGHGQRLGPLRDDIAGKDCGRVFFKSLFLKTEFLSQRSVEKNKARRGDRRRIDAQIHVREFTGIAVIE